MSINLVEVTTSGVVAGGSAIARDEDGRVLFVEGALPEETVSATIVDEKEDFRRGVVSEVSSPSPDRIEARCVHFNEGCGGCDWQMIDPAAQQRFKVDILRDSLRRIAHIEDAKINKISAVSAEDYRTTVRAKPDAEGRLQFRKRDDAGLLPVPNCIISHPLVRDVLEKGRFVDCNEVQIRVSIAQGKTLVTIDRDCPSVVVPEHSTVVVRTDALKHPQRTAQRETVGGHEWRVSATAFFQSGAQSAELLVQTINSIVQHQFDSKPIQVLDAYAGIGLLGGAVMFSRAIHGDFLISVEENSVAAGDASSNLSALNAHVINVEMAKFQWRDSASRPDVIIADPGRPGLAAKVAKKLARLGAKVIILVSCDPASMARDTAILIQQNYTLNEITPLDLFPQTSHVEAVSVFTKGSQ